MKVSKRQFLKVSFEGSAAILLGALFRPAALWASPVVVPADYLNSSWHSQWMKLSYNQGRESRQTRRCLGAALRNVGAIQGKGNGARFAPWFDQAVTEAFTQMRATGRKPVSVFGLVQALYDNFFYPRLGPMSGRVMFGTLLGILRGRDGTTQGATAHQAYLAYRRAALFYKNVYKLTTDPKQLLAARKARQVSLALWQQELMTLVETYALRKAALDPAFHIRSEMLEGFEIYVDPATASPPRARLTFTRAGDRLIISWPGDGILQQAPSMAGPWRDVAKSSPVAVDPVERHAFFRTVHR